MTSDQACERLIGELRKLQGDRLSMTHAVREHHSHGESYHTPQLSKGAAFPTSTDELSAIVASCTRQRTPFVPLG